MPSPPPRLPALPRALAMPLSLGPAASAFFLWCLLGSLGVQIGISLQEFRLVADAPVFLASLLGLTLLALRRDPRALGALAFYLVTAGVKGLHPDWTFGFCPPARYLLTALPVLLFGLALFSGSAGFGAHAPPDPAGILKSYFAPLIQPGVSAYGLLDWWPKMPPARWLVRGRADGRETQQR